MKHLIRMSTCLLIVSFLSGSGALAKDDQILTPSATITISSRSIAVGIGINWGTGTLTYKGKDYLFGLKGLSVMDLGASKATAKGEVYHLATVADFAGKYAALEGGFALGKGASDITMKNTKGVVINLTAATEGVQLILGGKGLSITMKEK
ncbi:MAG: DUF1134 domain-containing protein [Nitrospirota bacterium]|nr:DUF1134 domain-containing protein [Nitrospirota bacterium]MDH5587063.1 DUF1134 domain-containing protein [Nitrospirota bacterium]MDH5775161.1 DUF1134 domain-containing protein [Nitrospirota bacterium]